jgi:hypothetical protein
MRRWKTWGLGAAVLLGLALPVCGNADPPDDEEKPKAAERPNWRSKSIFDELFPSKDPPPNPTSSKPAKDSAKDSTKDSAKDSAKDSTRSTAKDSTKSTTKDSAKGTAKKPAPPPKKASIADDVAAQRDREEKAYLRRQAVCDRLREIAQQTKDEELERKVRQLDERIWAIYSQHTHRPPGTDDTLDVDQAALDQQLGSDSAQSTLSGPAADQLSGKDRARQASVREEKP